MIGLKSGRIIVAAVVLSVGFVILYSLLFDVRHEDIASIGLPVVLSASLLVAFRLLIQGLRFYLLLGVLDVKRGLYDSVMARVSSEFVSLTTPLYVGGEVVRLAWLRARNADLGEVAWILFLEIYVDVASTAAVILLSAYYLAGLGVYLLAYLATAVSLSTTAFFTFILIYSAKRVAVVPGWLSRLVNRVLGRDRGARVVDALQKTLLSYHSSAGSAGRRLGKASVAGIVLSTALMMLLGGAVTYLIIGGARGLDGLLLSTCGFYVSLVVGALPVTIGGSGLSELALSHFTSSVWGFSDWARVITWRLITYHLPLVLSGLSLAALSYRELILKYASKRKGI